MYKLTLIQLNKSYQQIPKRLENNKYFTVLYLEKLLPTKVLFYIDMKQQNHFNSIHFQDFIPYDLCGQCYDVITQFMMNKSNIFVLQKANLLLNYLCFQQQSDKKLDIELKSILQKRSK